MEWSPQAFKKKEVANLKIILDAMGGDHAPEAPVLGAIEAAKAFGAEITLVGRGEEILAVL